MADSKCICPVIDIKVTSVKHVTDAQAKEIADKFHAQVTLSDGSRGATVRGKHREECPCAKKSRTISKTGSGYDGITIGDYS